jgi:putative photosynthetic complex assembly protein
MSDAIDSKPFPKGALVGGGVLIATSLVLATVAALTDYGATRLHLEPVVAERDLAFKDSPAGAIEVYDVKSDRQIVSLAPGESGFIRVVLRGLARERVIHGEGPAAAFRLRQHTNGMASLEDLATGKIVTLTAFGNSNADAFLKLLNAGAKTP